MCSYQRIEENKPPICEYTKDFCTLCVLGNGNTYEEAERSKKDENSSI